METLHTDAGDGHGDARVHAAERLSFDPLWRCPSTQCGRDHIVTNLKVIVSPDDIPDGVIVERVFTACLKARAMAVYVVPPYAIRSVSSGRRWLLEGSIGGVGF